MPRIAEIDALRGIAALVIVVFHARYVWRYPVLGTAVDLFFVLSGYLITTILLDQRGKRGVLTRFYVRRSLRIHPIYYVAFLFVLAANGLFLERQSLEGWKPFALYLQNVSVYFGHLPTPFPRWFQHTWTLAIEEQFYLLWPLLVLTLGPRKMASVAIALLPLPLTLRWRGMPETLLLTRCDGLLLGALLAPTIALARRDPRWRRPIVASLGAACLFGVAGLAMWKTGLGLAPGEAHPETLVPRPVWAIRYSLLNVGFAGLVGLVILNAGAPWLKPLRWRPLVALGTISYGLYLYHPILNVFVHDRLVLPGHVGRNSALWIKMALALIAAVASWFAIERPILRLKDRLTGPGGGGHGEAVYRPHRARSAAGVHSDKNG